MTDLNKNLANLLDTGNDNRIENTSNLIESKNTLKTINKKKILYATIFGVMLINMQVSKTEGSSLSVNATHDCTKEGVSKNYTHTMDCTDIDHDMRGHFSSQNYWPDSMCHSYFNGDTALTSRTWYSDYTNKIDGHTAHTNFNQGYGQQWYILGPDHPKSNDGKDGDGTANWDGHASHTNSQGGIGFSNQNRRHVSGDMDPYPLGIIQSEILDPSITLHRGKFHNSSEGGTCTLITNEVQRICNEVSFNFNGHYKTDVINETDLNCRLNTAHGSHSSHGSHASHASHGSHGSHGSHASHGNGYGSH